MTRHQTVTAALKQLGLTMLLSVAGIIRGQAAPEMSGDMAGMQMPTRPAAQAPTSALPFTLDNHQQKSLSAEELAVEEKKQSAGAVSGTPQALTFKDTTIRLVVRTGPDEDMLSYRIAGLRNPTLVVPPHVTLSILFVNTDEDMHHDMRFGVAKRPFPVAPDISTTAGSDRLPPAAEGKYSGEELTLHAMAMGSYTYFCSVHGHAKGGMWGTIAVGVAPRAADDNSVPPDAAMASHYGQNYDMTGMQHGSAGMSHGMAMEGAGMPGMMAMRSSVNVNDPMSRESSGTAWMPDSTPMYGKMKMRGQDMLMLHGAIWPRYTTVHSSRDISIAGRGSDSRFDAPSWFMAMYSHPLDASAQPKSQLGLRVMLSADPLIEQGYGYPLLYQSGESYKGQPFHDRQHPHDLFSELSVTYSRRLGGRQSAYLYLGYPGEPALGPPTFMHRLSAMDMADAPISHHWQDSTHITFGVVTAGYSFGKAKIEASAFKGREPDQNRYNFDSPKLDSYSGRVSCNPTRYLALQVSHGFIKSPEELDPDVNRHRTTASIIYNRPLRSDANWSNSLVWGQNNDPQEGKTNSYLFETNYQTGPNTLYFRAERVQKSGHELVLAPADQNRIFGVDAYSIGYVRDLRHGSGLDIGLGVQATLNTNPSGLDPYYGSGTHGAFQIFFRIRPSRMHMDSTSMNGMDMNHAEQMPAANHDAIPMEHDHGK
jgi:rusticyanin